jgi:hypothetical protein
MDTLAHWALRLVLILCVMPKASVCLLDALGERLPSLQIDLVRAHECLGDSANIGNKSV